MKPKKPTIGIIDDDEIFQLILTKSIELISPSTKILQFSNGRDALNHLNQTENLPTIILLDLNMPVMSGWDFLDWFEKLNPEIRSKIEIYIVTSSIYQGDREKSLSYKFISGFLSKPIDEIKLKQILAK
jgi:CheY-like chemotaxis protein